MIPQETQEMMRRLGKNRYVSWTSLDIDTVKRAVSYFVKHVEPELIGIANPYCVDIYSIDNEIICEVITEEVLDDGEA